MKQLLISKWLEEYGTDALSTYFMSAVWQASEGQASQELINICNKLANEFRDAAQEFREFCSEQFSKEKQS